MPLPNYSPCMQLDNGRNEDEVDLISSYFKQGYNNREILEFLRLHGVEISISTLKRRLHSLGLFRIRRQGSSPVVSDNELRRIVQKELRGSGCFLGYRKMWARLRKKGILVNRDRVMKILRELDPDGVESRKKKRLRRRAYHTKGPNYIWHIDGHDKLKPFGFCIHGCIDGFSRRIIWLEVGPTNKNPEVIAKYYLEAVKQVSGLPRKMRSDDGTENSIVDALHTFLRSSHTDDDAGIGCFSIGRSTSNQRIESYWSQLVKDSPGWWISFFKDLRDLGLFNDSDPVHVECLRFCFMGVLRKELQEVAELWNQHVISASKFGNSSGPRGKPDCMYFLPHLYNTQDYKVNTDPLELDEFIDHTTMNAEDFSKEFEEFASYFMNERGIQTPDNVKEGLDLFFLLTAEIEKLSLT